MTPETRLAIHCAKNACRERLEDLQAAMTDIERLINAIDPTMPIPAKTEAAMKAAQNRAFEAMEAAFNASRIMGRHNAEVNYLERNLRRSAAQ